MSAVHPMERLRYVARADGAGVASLVEAAARALAGLGDDYAGLVTGCRQMVDRHPSVGPMWWLTSRMLCGERPRDEAWAVVEALEADPTSRELAAALPQDAVAVVLGWPELTAAALHRRGDVRVRAVDALGDGAALVGVLADAGVDAVEVPESGVGAAVARHQGLPVWVVAGEGRILPDRLWRALLARLDDGGDPWDADEEVVPLSLVDVVAGPWGSLSPSEAAVRTDCPIAAELSKGVFAPGTYRSPDGPTHRRPTWR